MGGVAGGASAATRARRLNESARIVIFDKGEHVSFANCGLPYQHQRGHRRSRQVAGGHGQVAETGVQSQVHTGHEVRRIDREGKQVEVKDLKTSRHWWESYDRLILSPGASPIVPPWMEPTGPTCFYCGYRADGPDQGVP